MPHNVQLTDATFGRLQQLAVPLVDTLESVVVRLADYWDDGHATNQSDVPPAGNDPEDADQLPQKAFRDPLIEALYQMGGRAKSRQATELVGRKVAPLLGPADRKLRPDGKQKWENLVHWNRFNLVKDGLFKKDSGHDIWELSEEGIKYAEGLIADRNISFDQHNKTGETVRTFNTKSVPNLRHTKLLSARVKNETIRPTWNGLLFDLISRIPKDVLEKPDEARRLIIVNFVTGKKEDEGYRFIPELGISVQGQDANDSWKGASHIAQRLGVPVEVEFLWRMKEGAAFPGSTGRLAVPGS
jgi:hypothetical protein